MEFNHRPVLLDECIENLKIKQDGTYIDCTLGGAGHAAEILRRLGSGGRFLGIDQDGFALEVSKKRLEDLAGQAVTDFERGNFRDIAAICGKRGMGGADGILMDLGTSSHQLDEAERGFSYQKDAPLDMRMDRDRSLDASKIVNEYEEKRIRDIIRDYGEEKWAARIAAFIAGERKNGRIETTGRLVEIIKAAIPSSARREGPHPAKRTFQALRIAVNDELGALEEAIGGAVSVLNPGGRLCIITFHSLEDRIVKNAFARKENPCTCPRDFPVCVCGRKKELRVVTKKPILPTEDELAGNPRSRSAKLRVAEKI